MAVRRNDGSQLNWPDTFSGTSAPTHIADISKHQAGQSVGIGQRHAPTKGWRSDARSRMYGNVRRPRINVGRV